jgi:hypothetical protein
MVRYFKMSIFHLHPVRTPAFPDRRQDDGQRSKTVDLSVQSHVVVQQALQAPYNLEADSMESGPDL